LERFQGIFAGLDARRTKSPRELDPRRKFDAAEYFSMVLFTLLNPVIETCNTRSHARVLVKHSTSLDPLPQIPRARRRPAARLSRAALALRTEALLAMRLRARKTPKACRCFGQERSDPGQGPEGPKGGTESLPFATKPSSLQHS
jgi:hypothetical protein